MRLRQRKDLKGQLRLPRCARFGFEEARAYYFPVDDDWFCDAPVDGVIQLPDEDWEG